MGVSPEVQSSLGSEGQALEAQLPRRPFVFFLSLIIKSCTLFWLGGARKALGVSVGRKEGAFAGG